MKKRDSKKTRKYTREERQHILNHELLPLVCRIRGLANIIATGDSEPVLLQALRKTAGQLDRKITTLIKRVNRGYFDMEECSENDNGGV